MSKSKKALKAPLPRIIGYIRCSTEEQAQEGMSLHYQRSKIQAYCLLHDLELVTILEDAGFSGKETNRPAYQQLLRQIADPEIVGVIVYRLDRLTRSFADLGHLLEVFKAANAGIYSVMENVDASTAIGRFVIGLLGLLATLEVDVLGERTKAGMEEARRQGVHVGSEPLGFKRAENRGLVQDEDETKVVERIRQLRKKKLPLREIAKIMNEEGHPTKRGGKWGAETVRLILKRIPT